MKKLQTIFFATACLLSSLIVNAQTIDEVVNKNIEALGGKDKLATLKTIRMEGSMNVMGNEVSIITTKSHQVGQRIDIAVMGMNGYQINTPTHGWSYMPFQGQSTPEAWTDDQLKGSSEQLDLQSAFLNYKEKGTQLELQGKETTEGVECYKIKATFKSGSVNTYYIDAKTNYLIKTSSIQKIQGEEKEQATVYSNYKKTPEGYTFAHTIVTTNGELNFEKIEVNKPVDEKLFSVN